ncbi:MAG: hypothetical protein Q9184_006107 [Pyrenodesmia sp. 2 TL-2023]
MLSRLLNKVQEVFVWPTEDSKSVLHPSPDQQLQSELAEAAQDPQAAVAMVATRSQDHQENALPTAKSKTMLNATPVKMPKGKRKNTEPSSSETKPRSSAKRRKVNNAQPSLEATPTTLAAVVIPITSHVAVSPHVHKAGKDRGSNDHSTGSGRPLTKEKERSPSSRENGNGNGIDTVPQPPGEEARPQTPQTGGKPDVNDQPAPAAATQQTASPKVKAKAKKLHGRVQRIDLTAVVNVSPRARSSKSDGRPASRQSRHEHSKVGSLIHPSPRPTSSTPDRRPDSRHKRFANEEITFSPSLKKPPSEELAISDMYENPRAEIAPKDLSPEPSTMHDTIEEFKAEITVDPSPEQPVTRGRIQDSEADSGSDEAPEVVTKSTGLEKARSAMAEATKAVKAQRAAGKQKRRDRDTLLKLQARATKEEAEQTGPRDVRLDTPTANEMDGRFSTPPLKPATDIKWPGTNLLPALLPDEILAAEPMPRLPTPSPEPPEPALVKAPMNRRQRFLEENPKPPEDVRKGNVRIRVLEDRGAILPPKVSKQSQSIRESWLAGRPGAKGKAMMERRKIGGGFVRR